MLTDCVLFVFRCAFVDSISFFFSFTNTLTDTQHYRVTKSFQDEIARCVRLSFPWLYTSCLNANLQILNVAGKPLGTYRVRLPHSLIAIPSDNCHHSQAKIALKAKSEDQLLELEAIAKSLNLCARSVMIDPCVSFLFSIGWRYLFKFVICDFRGNGDSVRAVLAIGPGPVGLINEVTGKLRLLWVVQVGTSLIVFVSQFPLI